MATLIIGTNKIINCAHTLVVHGKEVFRLRRRDGDDQLVADFDLCDSTGATVAKVVKNNIVQASIGMKVNHGPNFSEVVDGNGKVVGRAEEITPDVIQLIGTFGVPGTVVHASAEALQLPNLGTINNCTFNGTGTAIEFQKNGSMGLGKSATPPRPGFRQKSTKALPQKQKRPRK